MPATGDLKALARTIPDEAEPSIQFRDITTPLLDPRGLSDPVADRQSAGIVSIILRAIAQALRGPMVG